MIDSSATTGIFEYPIPEHGSQFGSFSLPSPVQKTDLCDGENRFA
jgi:hypothetical protein